MSFGAIHAPEPQLLLIFFEDNQGFFQLLIARSKRPARKYTPRVRHAGVVDLHFARNNFPAWLRSDTCTGSHFDLHLYVEEGIGSPFTWIRAGTPWK